MAFGDPGAERSIELGSRCIIAEHCTVRDQDHLVDPDERRKEKAAQTAPIVLERDVWIGAGVRVLQGVRVGEGTVVAANAVVRGDVPPESSSVESQPESCDRPGPPSARPILRIRPDDGGSSYRCRWNDARSSALSGPDGERMLIFRFDDYSAAERIKVEVDETIFRTFRTHKVPLTVAVTPSMVSDVHDAACESYSELGDPTDGGSICSTRASTQAGSWPFTASPTVDLSSETTPNSLCCRAPFRWHEFGKVAKSFLDWFPSASLRVFVPPWNSFDSITVEAASANSFDVLCAGASAKAAVRSGVRIIPSIMSIEELLSFCQVFSLPRLLADLAGTSLVVTLHEYEFRRGDQPDWRRLDALEATISAIAGSQVPCGTL